jgi:hypothetical protein
MTKLPVLVGFVLLATLITAQTPPPAASGYVYLSDLTPTGTPINGYGPYEKDRSPGEDAANDGLPIKIGRITYAKGLGVHPASELTFSINKQYERFTAVVGIDDELLIDGCAPMWPGSVVFQVFADGTKMFDSGVLSVWSPPKTVEVDVRGKSALRLVVGDAGDGYICDHADWADAKLTAAAMGTTVTAGQDFRTLPALNEKDTAAKLIGTWKWSGIGCAGFGSTDRRVDRDIRVTFVKDSAFTISDGSKSLAKGKWRLYTSGRTRIEISSIEYLGDLRNVEQYFKGFVAFPENKVGFYSSYSDGCDHIFDRI